MSVENFEEEVRRLSAMIQAEAAEELRQAKFFIVVGWFVACCGVYITALNMFIRG